MSDIKLNCVTISTSKGTGKVNEDNVCCYKNIFWVFDGSTPIKPISVAKYETQARWLSQEFQEALKIIIDSYPEDSIDQILGRSVELFLKKNATIYLNFDIPSMTMALAAINGSVLDMYVIGDCVIYLLTKAGISIKLQDGRVGKYEKKTINVFKKYRNNYLLKEKVRTQREKNRKMMNKPDGYWVITPDKSWLSEIRRFSHEIEDCKSILLCTDGFDRLFGMFNLIKPESVLNQELPLNECQSILRTVEQDDVECLQYPRLKISDDSTAILITF